MDLPEYFTGLTVDREIVMSLLESISGNRVHYAVNTIGGIRKDVSSEWVSAAKDALKKLEDLSHYLIDGLEYGRMTCPDNLVHLLS